MCILSRLQMTSFLLVNPHKGGSSLGEFILDVCIREAYSLCFVCPMLAQDLQAFSQLLLYSKNFKRGKNKAKKGGRWKKECSVGKSPMRSLFPPQTFPQRITE